MKDLLKSRKFIYAVATLVIMIVAKLIPAIPDTILVYIVAIGVALITGHTITDAAAALKIK